jgi:hypothetical protein
MAKRVAALGAATLFLFACRNVVRKRILRA